MKSKIFNNKQINIWNGIFLASSMNLVNPYFSKFAIRLGASDYEVAMISSLPALIAVFTLLPGALWLNSTSNKHKLTGIITFAQKIFYLLFALLPLLPINNKSFYFVVLVGLMNLPGALAIMGYQSTIGDIFLPIERNSAMSLRNRYSDLSKLIIVFLSGQFLQQFAQNNETSIKAYQLIFLIAFIIALGEVFTFMQFKNIPKNNVNIHKSNILKELIKDLSNQKHFLSFVLCSLIFHFGWQMGWPLFSIYQINYLHADEGWLGIINVVASLASILTVTRWSILADSKSNTFALSLATLGMSITPILYTIARSLKIFTILNILPGACTAGTLLILFNLLLEVTPEKNRTIYIALYTTLINISATISPLIGIWIKNNTNIYFTLCIVGILRLIGSISFFIRNKSISNLKT